MRHAATNRDASLAQLLAYWLSDPSISQKELMILTLESVRDDFAQATTTHVKRVTDSHVVRDYLNEQIAELGRLWNIVHAVDCESPMMPTC
jgi:hypothetical protein